MKFPKRNIDILLYQDAIRTLMNDVECAIFLDTNILSQLYRLNDKARQDFYKWISSCNDRIHIPAWVIHEYSDKVYSGKIKDYLSELSKIKTYTKEISGIADFVKGYVGESLLKGSSYQGKTEDLKKDIDEIANKLEKISKAINNSNLDKHQNIVHEEIVKQLESKVMPSDIFDIVNEAEDIFSQRSHNRIPPGYKDSSKEENSAGDYIIWTEILKFCKENDVKKAILITRDMKSDIVYAPDNQIADGIPVKSDDKKIKIAKPCLIHEFYTHTNSEDFYVVDFKTFVKIFASQYKELALSFQLAIAEEEKESAEAEKEEFISYEYLFQGQKVIDLQQNEEQEEEQNEEQYAPLYSGEALADGQYNSEAKKGFMDEYITQLKTYNWYVQNPAIDKVSRMQKINAQNNLENRSSFFVLGRNLVQAAVGSSGNAIMFMENYSKYIKEWENVFKQALIDGMLFEVFFNSEGKIRPNDFKANFLEDIITNVEKLAILNPYDFINSRIKKVDSRFVPTVGDNQLYKFSFTIDGNGNTTALKCNGKDISNTFMRFRRYQFADVDKVDRALSDYYGIIKKNITVDGIPDDFEVVLYIAENEEYEEEFPF